MAASPAGTGAASAPKAMATVKTETVPPSDAAASLEATVTASLAALRRMATPVARLLTSSVERAVAPPDARTHAAGRPRAAAGGASKPLLRWLPTLTPAQFAPPNGSADKPREAASPAGGAGSAEAGQSERSPRPAKRPPASARRPVRKAARTASLAEVDIDADDDDASVLFLASSAPVSPATPLVPVAAAGVAAPATTTAASGRRRRRSGLSMTADPNVIEIEVPRSAKQRARARPKAAGSGTLSSADRDASVVLSGLRHSNASGRGDAPKLNLAALWSAAAAASTAADGARPTRAVVSSMAMLDTLKRLHEAGLISTQRKQWCKTLLLARTSDSDTSSRRAWLEAALSRCAADADLAECAETLNAIPV